MSQVHLRLKKSVIRMEQSQRDTVRTLGFRKLNQVISVKDTPEVRGMIRKVGFALDVLAELPKPSVQWKGITVEPGSGLPEKKKAAAKPAAKKKTTKKKSSTGGAAKKTTKKKTTKKAVKK